MARRAKACAPEPVRRWVAPLLVLLGTVASAVVLLYVFGDDAAKFWWVFLEVVLGGALALGFIWLAPRRLGYRATPSRLRIRTFIGAVEVAKGGIQRARLVDYRLGLKTIGSELPGYYVGGFRSNLGGLQAFVSRKRGRGVLLELKDGRKLLINPRNPQRCLEPLRLELEEGDERSRSHHADHPRA